MWSFPYTFILLIKMELTLPSRILIILELLISPLIITIISSVPRITTSLTPSKQILLSSLITSLILLLTK